MKCGLAACGESTTGRGVLSPRAADHPQETGRKADNGSDQVQNSRNRNSHDPEGQQQQPYDWI